MEETVSGTLKLQWRISEKDAGIAKIKGELTKRQLARFYDRVEDVIMAAFSRSVDVEVDGEGKPPVHVEFDSDMGADVDIELMEGPVNGTLGDLRAEL